MQTDFLLEIYHGYFERFDGLIRDQVAAGDAPCPVLFAGEALALFHRRGFDELAARRFFAIFYQMRRAFHFIAGSLMGRSRSMNELRQHLWQNVFTHDIRWYEQYLWNRMEDFSTLLLGETGTGKGTAAAAIGRSGFIPFDEKKGVFAESFARSFVALNLSQFSETLIESELFGHKKGAFTGALESHEGVFARCSPHGAIFLDEIGEAGAPIQIKLLQVLQERFFCPVGSHEKIRFRGRVIAATNKPLGELRGAALRDDFFYRLCSDVIVMPALRDRLREEPEELSLLLGHLLARMMDGPSKELIRWVGDAIQKSVGANYEWPGNVRELEQAIRQVLVHHSYRGETSRESGGLAEELGSGIAAGDLDANRLVSGYCALLYQRSRNYEEVARQTKLDRRTVKRHILSWK